MQHAHLILIKIITYLKLKLKPKIRSKNYPALCTSDVKTFLTHLLKNMPKIGLDRTNQITRKHTRKQETIDKERRDLLTNSTQLTDYQVHFTFVHHEGKLNFYKFLSISRLFMDCSRFDFPGELCNS